MHTMALAFSGQAGAAIKHGGKSLGGGAGGASGAFAGAGGSGGGGAEAATGGGFEDSWMVTAALIVSNKVGVGGRVERCRTSVGRRAMLTRGGGAGWSCAPCVLVAPPGSEW